MGVIKSKETTLRTSELNEFHNMTLFSHEILIKLHEYFKRFSSLQVDDGVIDYDEFVLIMKKNDRNLTKKIFNAIDLNNDGTLNYREFIKFISIFINGTLDEQIALSFKVFADVNSQIITYESFKAMMYESIKAEAINDFFTMDIIDEMIKQTFNDLNNGDAEIKQITFDQYKEMIKKHPYILNWMKVDLTVIQKPKGLIKPKKIGCFSLNE